MILYYQGFNKSWSMEEAQVINYSFVSIESFRKEIVGTEKEIVLKIMDYIREQTQCPNNILFSENVDIGRDDELLIISFDNSHARVFSGNSPVEILNTGGNMVLKIC